MVEHLPSILKALFTGERAGQFSKGRKGRWLKTVEAKKEKGDVIFIILGDN